MWMKKRVQDFTRKFEHVKLLQAKFDRFSRSKTPKFHLLAYHDGLHYEKFYAPFKQILALPLHSSIVVSLDGGSWAASILWLHHVRKTLQIRTRQA